MWRGVGWICALLSLSCNAPPDVAAIQSAYERESSSGSALHDGDLQVLEAKCHDDKASGMLCEVTFLSKRDPAEQLYFDVVAVARSTDGWALKSGLCKR